MLTCELWLIAFGTVVAVVTDTAGDDVITVADAGVGAGAGKDDINSAEYR